jgi:pimeloyl-[acyl-carrier protein] methyl ester esterase
MSADLVLIPGWGMSAAVWDGLPAGLGLGGGLNPHPIELPGHGAMPFPPPGGGAALDDWAQALLAAAPPRAIWLGWSLGGLVALAAALRAPERVSALVLMTATPRFVQAPDWTPAMPAATLGRFHDGLVADPAGTLERFLALQVRGSDQGREVLRGLRRGLRSSPQPDPAALALGLDLLRQEDLRHRLAGLVQPSLWLFGSHDTLVPAAAAPAVAGLAPGARTLVLDGAAHAPFLSHPRECALAIRAFVAGIAP